MSTFEINLTQAIFVACVKKYGNRCSSYVSAEQKGKMLGIYFQYANFLFRSERNLPNKSRNKLAVTSARGWMVGTSEVS